VVEQLLARARVIMPEESEIATAARVDVTSSRKPIGVTSGPVCVDCNLPNHLAKDCLLPRRTSAAARGEHGRGEIRCFRCGRHNHIASSCPGKAAWKRSSAPNSPASLGLLHSGQHIMSIITFTV